MKDPKNTSTENWINRAGIAKGLPTTPIVPSPNLGGDKVSAMSVIDKMNLALKNGTSAQIESIPVTSFSNDPRYSTGTRPGDNWEEAYAQNQSRWSKAVNGTTKGLGLVATTFAGGIGTFVYGIPSALVNGDITKVWDNELNQGLQSINEKLDRELLPNFYTQQEQEAEWWSRDNWFTANFLFDKLIKNSGYAVGAMVGGNMANTILLRAGSAIGKATSTINTTNQASQAFKLFSPLLRNTSRAFSQGKNKEVYEASISKLSSIADVAKRENQLAQILNTSSKFANFGDTGRRTLVALYSSAGEASMEAIMGGNQLKENLIQKYIEENGVVPEGEALKNIDETVRSFGKNSFFGNMALLGVTEFVQLPYLAGSSWKNSRNAILNSTDDVVRTGSKLAEVASPTTIFGKLYQGAKKYGSYVFDPKEMGQEIGQYALEVGTSNYFEKANQTDEAENILEGMLNFFSEAPSILQEVGTYGLFGRDEEGEGVGALVSKEGIEGGILGGLTGGIMQAGRKYSADKQRKTNTKALIEASENAPILKEVLKDRIRTVNRGIVLQEQQQAATLQNDILESKDLKTDLAFNYAMHKIKYGRTDLVLDDIREMKEQIMKNPKGFADLQEEKMGNVNDNPQEFLSRLNEIESFVKNLDETYTSLNTLYGAETITNEEGKLVRRFSDAAIERMAYATTKIKDYDSRIPELKSKIGSKGIVLEEALSDLVQNPESTSIDKKILEVDGLDSLLYTDGDKAELKKNILGVTDLTLRKKLFIEELNDIIKKPENYTQNVSEKSTIDTVESSVPTKKIKIKTPSGEIEVETNTPYRLGKIVDYTKDGKEVYRAPVVEILGENEDGSIKVKDVQKGDVFDVSKETIEDYYLFKESDLNPTATFVLENFNTKFRHKGLKNDGKPAIGRIFNQKGQIIFEYVNSKGVLKRIPVRKNQFEAQGDYTKGMIVPVGKYTAIQEKSLKDLLSIKEEITEDEVLVRNQFLSKLYEDGVKRIEQIEKSLSSKKQEIEKISEKIENLSKTKTGEPRKRITSALRQQIESLNKLKNSLEKQLEAEQIEKEELEYTIPFFKDMIVELSEFPEDNSAFIDKLKSDINLLEDLINITDKSIDETKKLIEYIDELFLNTLSVFNDYIKRLKEENPNIPLGIEQLQANVEKFLGEEGASIFIEERQGFTAKVLELEADINDFENELKIPELNKKAETLVEDLKELSEGIDKLIGEQLTKRDILEKFQKFVDEKKQMEAEEEKLSTNKKFKEQALKTEDKSTVQTKYTNPNYEPNKKKASNILPISTVGIDRGKPHQTRARIFGANLLNYKDVFGVYVNENNEGLYRLSGMIDLIRTDDGVVNESIASNKILALVMVNGNGELLGVDGKPLSAEQLADAKNHAIFQVKPDPDFTWKSEQYGKGESMFRKGTPENVKKAIIEKYKKEKEALLAETGKGILHTVAASWGIPEFTLNEEGEINYEAKNSVESTGLIDPTTDKGNNSLEGKQLITVPTINDIESQGLTSYADALGKPFLMKDNAVVPLINKKHTQAEAESIFDALLTLSKIALEGKQGMKDPKAIRILNYLRGVVYWGIPINNTGYNSIFFDTNPETGKLTLTISNKGYDVVFTPTELERNRGEVIDKIKNLHNNINSSLIKKINQKFEQIVSISSEGEFNSIMWPNYQSYLLADRFPDTNGKITTKGKNRESNNIPLTTPMRKLKNSEDVNRHSIYFYTTDNLDDYTFQELKEAKKEASKKMTPGQVTSKQKYLLDGQTDNQFVTPGGKTLLFTSPSNVNESNFLSVIKLGIEPDTMAGFIEIEKSINPELTEEQVIQEIVKNIKAAIFREIIEYKKQAPETVSTEEGGASKLGMLSGKTVSKTEAPTPTETAPVSTDAKADIESFETAKGSVYTVLPNGKTQRFKTATGEQNEPNDLIVFVKFKDAQQEQDFLSAQNRQDGKKLYVVDSAGNVYDTNEQVKGKDVKLAIIKDGKVIETVETSLEPKIGYNTFDQRRYEEKGEKYRSTHLGNKVTKINYKKSISTDAKVEGGSKLGILKGKTSEKEITIDDLDKLIDQDLAKPSEEDSSFRLVIDEEINSVENWNEVETFVKKAMPTIPFYRVKNILQATNGRQAWGMLQDGAIYVYENAEVGTAYHEVFEAVWKMFSTPEEQQNIIKEFKSRTGTFVDRPTGKTVKYSEATNQEIKEQLAEEFRDYVQFKKVPVKPKDGRPYIVKLFADIVNAIKAFFLGPQAARNTEELFKRIGKGYYAKNNKYSTALSYANKGIIDINDVEVSEEAELREKLSDFEMSDVVEEMTYATIVELVSTDKNLFQEIDLPKSELYPMLEAHIETLLRKKLVKIKKLYSEEKISKEQYDLLMERNKPIVLERINELRNSWDEIVVKFEEKLNSFGIEFDENDNVQLTNEDKTKEIEYDATKIDHYKKANPAIKLLLATLPKMNADGTRVLSSINGNKMIPVGQVYVSLLNNLSSSKNTDEMLTNLKEMAKNDVNYRRLYKRLTKQDYDQGDPSLSKLKYTHETRLITALWKSVKKYNADVRNVQILDNGDINVGIASLSTVANQLRDKYISNIIADAKQNKGYFIYNEAAKAYTGNPIRLRSVDLTNKEGMVKFLSEIGINFSVNELTNLELNSPRNFKSFKEAVFGIRQSITNADPIFKFTKTSLGISGNLLKLGFIKARLDNPIVNSTHYNINGDLTQSYIGPNVASQLYEFLSSAEGLTPEAFQNFPHLSYLLTDSFVEGSVLLDKMFTGDRTQRKQSVDTDDLFKVGYAGGLNNEQKGKAKESAKLNYKERLIQELNLNLEGWYLNLVPGDSSLEHDIYLSNLTSADELISGMNTINSVFKGYFMSELKMSREDRPVVKGRDSRELRFFKDILADQSQKTDAKVNKLHNDIINEPETKTPEEVYKKYEKKINEALNKFIEKDTVDLINTLISYNIIKLETSMSGETTYTVSNIKIDGRLSKEELFRTFKAITINYMSANIELQKLIYSDPYQYSDQLKRTKSFDSPRQLIIGGQDSINDVFNEVWNKGYEKDDIGYTDFNSGSFKTVTLKDVTGITDLPGYSDYTETDGSGIISYKGYRHLRIRAGEWNDAEESQYRYEMAWEKRDKNLKLSLEEEAILEQGNPQVQSAYTTQKPIVSGNKADGNDFNDIVLDKFALYPLSYRVMKELNPDSNVVKLYNKMQSENIDYVVFESGRKVGSLNPHSLYVNGKFNNAPFVTEGDDRNVVNVPFEIISIQTEVPSKEKALVTRGSQVTKLLTLDFMNAGVPIDFEVLDNEGNPIRDFATIYSKWYSLSKEQKLENSELYKEIIRNQELLEAITEEGFNSLLKSLGIVKTKEGYRIENKEKTANTLRKEIIKREVNDNVSKALLQFFDNDVILESTPAYQQVRNILYSIADREFISPKISGGLKVQIPSTLLESVRAEEKTINGKTGYVSNNLKFYEDEDGKRIAEFMVGRWFDSDMSDAELLTYLNETPEGQKILTGMAFRIPTQKQNSIDRFVIKQFLPKEFGDNVVVPAELVAKVGSDFDIDKLSMYFKNVKVGKDGLPKLIELLTDENSTVEERYIKYVKENATDYNDIVKELNYSEEALAKQEKIKENFKKVDKAKEEKDEAESVKEKTFNIGYAIFKKLPKPIQQIFKNFESQLVKEEIEGLEKNLSYRGFASELLDGYEKLDVVEISMPDGTDVKLKTSDFIPTLRNLIQNYDEVIESYGVSSEAAQKFYDKLSSAKSIKEFLNKKFALERAQIIAEFTGLDSIEEFGTRPIYLQNSKKALQNAYIESSENLISHPMNFRALIQPNSAEQLKDLSKKIVKETVGSTFDYKSVGNMLKRNFMSRLRHAFVTGKYAIGIAAVNQTNQSLNQRQPILLDVTRIASQDRYWLNNGSISFKKYNKVSINGRVFPTLSLIKNAERSETYPEGQDISDLIGQFIDGYVDISKGPWIMELGATPNVASTWLFLIKLGVPVEEVAYFMNQPIVRDYLKSVETAGYSYLFMENFVDNMLSKYTKNGKVETVEQMNNKRKGYSIPNLTYLKNSVGKDASEMSAQDLEQQRLMLFEFLKYAKMGEQVFHLTQGSNFDTASFNDPYLVFKKQIQFLKAQSTILTSIDDDGKTIIPAVNAILKNSFIGPLAQSIFNFRESVSESNILMSDKKKVRSVLQNVLMEYVDMNNRDFVRLAQKAVNDFFDWIVQTKSGADSLNKYIKEYLVKNGGITPEIVGFLKEAKNDPNISGNLVVQMLEVVPSARAEEGGANNIKIKTTDNQVSDQNAVIFAFRELRDYLQSYGGEYKNLYEKIVMVSMLQSGLSNSPISFSSLLPYEDFQPTYNSILSRMDNIEGIEKFYELGVFQKNNWNNDEIVPNERAGYTPSGDYNPAMKFLKEHVKIAVSKNLLPVILTQSVRSRSSQFDHMVYSYEVDIPGVSRSKQKEAKDKMRKAGNYSFIKKGLFKKVKDDVKGTYLTYGYTDKNGNEKEYYVYKLVNAWGESFRANEFYDVEKPSVIDNGMMKTDAFDDAYVVEVFRGGKKSLSQRISEATTKPNISNTEKVSTSEPTVSNLDNDYMYEPFTYEESNFDIYDDPKNSVSLPSKANKPGGLPSINRTNKKC
jgi:hypothetical protein